MDLDRIDLNRGDVRCKVVGDFDLTADRPVEHALGLAHQGVQIDLLGLRGTTPAEGQQLLRQLRRPRAGLARLGEVLADRIVFAIASSARPR